MFSFFLATEFDVLLVSKLIVFRRLLGNSGLASDLIFNPLKER